MVERQCRSYGRTADAGAYCLSCAGRIMPKALLPQFHGRWWKLGQPGAVSSSSPSPQQRLFQ